MPEAAAAAVGVVVRAHLSSERTMTCLDWPQHTTEHKPWLHLDWATASACLLLFTAFNIQSSISQWFQSPLFLLHLVCHPERHSE